MSKLPEGLLRSCAGAVQLPICIRHGPKGQGRRRDLKLEQSFGQTVAQLGIPIPAADNFTACGTIGLMLTMDRSITFKAVAMACMVIVALGGANKVTAQSAESRDRGIAAIERGDYATGISLLTEILQNGSDPEVLFWRGVGQSGLGHQSEAIVDVRSAIELGFDSPISRTVLGQLHIANGNAEAGEQILREAVEIWPDDPSTHLQYARGLFGAGRFEAAAQSFRRATELAPDHAYGYFALGWTLNELRRYNDVVEAYTAGIEHGMPGGEIFRRRADAYAAIGERELARSDYTQAIALEPENSTFYQARGHFEERSRLSQALADYSRSAELAPDWALPHNNAGHVLNELGRYEEALVYLNEAVLLAPEWSLPWNNRGISIQHTGDLGLAIENYREAVRLNPDYGNAHSNLALLLRLEEETLDEALFHSREALRVNPESALYLNTRGLVLEGQRNYEAAIEAFQNALTINPGYHHAHRNLGWVLFLTGHIELAEVHLATSIRRGAAIDSTRLYLVRVLAARGKFQEALQELERLDSLSEVDERLKAWLEARYEER